MTDSQYMFEPFTNIEGTCNLSNTQFADIAQIHAQSFDKSWSASDIKQMFLTRNGKTTAYIGSIVKKDAQIIGFIIWQKMFDEAEIITVAIAKQYRNKGIAKQLLKYELKHLKQNGVVKFFLEVSEYNLNAIALYKSLNFTKTSIRKKYYKIGAGKTADAHVYSL